MAFELKGFEWKNIDMIACERAVMRPNRRKFIYLPSMIHSGALVIIIGISFLCLLIFDLNVKQTLGVYAVGIVLYSVFGLRRVSKVIRKKQYEGLLTTRFRQGPVEIKFDHTGLSYKAKYATSFYQWESIIAVLDIPNMLVLQLSEIEYVPVPESTLPEGMTKQQAKQELETYILTAQ